MIKKIGIIFVILGGIALIASFVIGGMATAGAIGGGMPTATDLNFIQTYVPLLGYTAPVAGIGLTVGILLLVFAAVKKAFFRPKVNTEGFLLAVGEVTSSQETGMVMNGNPKLRIQFFYAAQDGRIYNAEIHDYLGYEAVNQSQPGSMVMILYDPSNPQMVVVPERSPNPGELLKAKVNFMVATGVYDRNKADIVEQGTETKGVIMTCKPTEEMVGRRRVWEIDVNVEKAVGGNYKAHVSQAVLPDQEVYMVPGTIVKVYYKPYKEDEIVVAFFVE